MKKISLVLFLSAGIFIFGVFFIWSTTAPIKTNLRSMRWEKLPNILLIFDVQREFENGIVFITLKDGRSQFIAGEWDANFTDLGNAYAYGKFPPASSEQKGQQLYYFVNDYRIFNIELKNIHGKILSVQENPKTTYMMVEFAGERRNLYCIAARVGEENEKQVCDQIQVGTESRGLWNPKKEREAVILNEAGMIFTLDPWEWPPKNISDETEQKHYQELKTLFEKKYNSKQVLGKDIKKIFNLLIVKNNQNKRSYYRIPFFSKITWLADADHVLIKEKDRLTTLELSTNKIATVIEEEDIGTKKIKFRNSEFDQTF